MIRTSMTVSATALAAAYTALQVLGRRAGSSAEERKAQLPGDELVPDPQMVMDHGRTIRARPDEIWPWLTQMGWHLGGYFVMATGMLRGLKSRAEAREAPRSSGRKPLRPELYIASPSGEPLGPPGGRLDA